MKGRTKPSADDYARFNRALSGILVIMLAYVWIAFAATLSDDWLLDALFFVLYSSIPVIGLVVLHFKPVTRQSDPQGEIFVKGSTIGRRAAFLLGIGHIALAAVCFLTTESDWGSPTILLMLIGGAVWLCWSYQPQHFSGRAQF